MGHSKYQVFFESNAEEFAQAFTKSFQETEGTINEEANNLVGDNNKAIKELTEVFPKIFNKFCHKYKNSDDTTDDFFNAEVQKNLSRGGSFKKIILSKAMYHIRSCSNCLIDNDLENAFKNLAIANYSLGEYRNYDEFCLYLDKENTSRVSFKRCTLLKLIYFMAVDGYQVNEKTNHQDKVERINERLIKHNIVINTDEIDGFLVDSYQLVDELKDFVSMGTVEKIDRTSMLKLIIGMAIDKYNYNPDKDRNNTAKTLCRKLNNDKYKAILINIDTIRDCLNEAKKIIKSC